MRIDKTINRLLLAWVLILVMGMNVSASLHAEEHTDQVVKVGYVLTPGIQEGGEGEYKTGQGYEYLQKIASYTGWTYEYVYGDFNELLDKLEAGEIDLMGSISYTKERAKRISYGQNEAGKEAFYLYVNGMDAKIQGNDITTINGKIIGAMTGTYQEDAWRRWCRDNHIRCRLVEYKTEEEIREALNDGSVDGAIGMLLVERSSETEQWRSVLKFGDAPYYFGVNKDKPELLDALNKAQSKILSENPYYNEELSTRYLHTDNMPSEQFSKEEEQWLDAHPHHLKVGCLDGYLPLSDKDDDGNMVGVLPDLYRLIEEKYADYDIQFEIVVYSEYKRMIADLKDGKLDIASPIYGDYWNADREGICLTDPVLSTTMLLLHEGAYSPEKIQKIGVDEKSPLQMAYAEIYCSAYELVYYPSMDDSAKALREKKVDAALSSACSYHVAAQNNSIMRDMNRVTLPEEVNISMAVSKNNPELMSIMNRGFALVGETAIFNSLAMHSNVERAYTLGNYISHNPITVFVICSIIFCIMCFYIARLKNAIRKAETDPMTGLLNKVAMREQIKEQLSQGGVLFMIDVDNFKLVNDVLGHKEGDKVLTQFASNLGSIFRTGDLIGRFGGDEFMVFLPKSNAGDEMIASKVMQMQQALENYNVTVADKKVKCSVSVGVIRIQPNEDISYADLFEKADAALYEAKKKGKNTYVIGN